jgi:uncharacterized protein
MRFHVAGLMKEPVGSVRRFDIDEPIDLHDENIEAAGPARGHARLMRTNDGILATGDLAFPVRLQCGRCLTPFEAPIQFHFEDEYKPSLSLVTGLPITYDPDDDSFLIDDHHILELTEAARQYALTALPMLPLCREDCAGLCPTCGHNRNEGPCDCAPDTASSPFAALKGLFTDDDWS